MYHQVLLWLVVALASSAPVPLIIDTDIGGGGCKDVDDVAAICIGNALADNGEATLIAVVQNTEPPPCAGTISVLNTWYGRQSVPIGAYKGGKLSSSQPLSYVDDLVKHFPSPIKNTSQVPDAVHVYRKALAAQDDSSVVISSIGLLTNLQDLLLSPPDSFSPLSGHDLVAQKVKLLAVMGGKYPTSDGHPECNVCGGGGSAADKLVSSEASSYVAANWPSNVKLLWSGFNVGVQVQCGGRLSTCAPKANPCRQAIIDYEGGEGKSRYAWDPLTTAIAVRGAQALATHECASCNGHNVIDAQDGNNHWVSGPFANQTYIVLDDAKKAGDVLDDLLCQPPKHAR